MKINIVLPYTKPSGGVRMVFQYANYLTGKGHEVICYYPKVGTHFGNLKNAKNLYQLLFIKPVSDGSWFKAKFKLSNPISINNHSISDGDIVIATAWSTASLVQNLSRTKGKKVYFIQGFETWGSDETNKMVLETYGMSWDKAISVSTALHDRLINETGLDSIIIYNGVHKAEISEAPKQLHDDSIVVGFPYRADKHKNCGLALEVLIEIYKNIKNVQVVSYGMKLPEQWPKEFDFLEDPSREQLFDFYDKVDIFYVPSLYEGWGLPAVEAMGHGCAVLAADSGSIHEFGEDNQNCLIIKDPTDKQEIRKKLECLIYSDNDRLRIGNNARNLVKGKCSFEKQAELFERELLNI